MLRLDLLAVASTERNVGEGIALTTLRGTESLGIEGLDGLVPVLGIAVHIVGRDEDLGLTGVSARVTRTVTYISRYHIWTELCGLGHLSHVEWHGRK